MGRSQRSVARSQKTEDRKRKSVGRKQLAQNFLTSECLVRRLVQQARIRSGDTVIDIGAGRGIITAALARVAGRVIAIEKDPRLVVALRERFRTSRNVGIIECDFVRYRIPVCEFKVVANIPYNETTAIVRKLLEVGMSEGHLIMQKEPARRFTGVTLFSLLAKPYFEFEIVNRLRRTDFHPTPSVDSVVLRITRRDTPLVEPGFREFVSYAFRRYKPNLRLAYKEVFTYKQWKRLARNLGFGINATATELTFEQWLGLYRSRNFLS